MSKSEKNFNVTQTKPVTAEEIINEILAWDDPAVTLNNLRELMDVYFLSKCCKNDEFVKAVYCTYQVLSEALKKAQTLKHERAVA